MRPFSATLSGQILIVQAELLRDLNKRGNADAVIQHFESGRVTSTEASLGEYVRALAQTDKLNGSSLLRTLQVDNLPTRLFYRELYYARL